MTILLNVSVRLQEKGKEMGDGRWNAGKLLADRMENCWRNRRVTGPEGLLRKVDEKNINSFW